jgi:putative ABC transport system substrate-binding protein
LGLLREMVPTAALIAAIHNPGSPNFEAEVNELEQGARSVGQQIVRLKASTEREIDAAFATLVRLRAGALMVASGGGLPDEGTFPHLRSAGGGR